jgi:hypothetical protein
VSLLGEPISWWWRPELSLHFPDRSPKSTVAYLASIEGFRQGEEKLITSVRR